MSTPAAPSHPRRLSDHLPSIAEIGPLLALVLACGFFILPIYLYLFATLAGTGLALAPHP